MKLYRSLGRHWTGTQSDAKAAQGGKDFEQFEVPTDKAGLLDFLNTFDVRPGDTVPARAEEQADELDHDPLGDILGTAPPATVIKVTAGPGAPTAACPACARDARAASMSTSAEAAVCAMADLEDITDPDVIDRMVERLLLRKGHIQSAAADPLGDVLG